jgi:hypothetical protein
VFRPLHHHTHSLITPVLRRESHSIISDTKHRSHHTGTHTSREGGGRWHSSTHSHSGLSRSRSNRSTLPHGTMALTHCNRDTSLPRSGSLPRSPATSAADNRLQPGGLSLPVTARWHPRALDVRLLNAAAGPGSVHKNRVLGANKALGRGHSLQTRQPPRPQCRNPVVTHGR